MKVEDRDEAWLAAVGKQMRGARQAEVLAPWPGRLVRQGIYPSADIDIGEYFVDAVSYEVEAVWSERETPVVGTICPQHYCLQGGPAPARFQAGWAVSFNAVAMRSLERFVVEDLVNFYVRLVMPSQEQRVLCFQNARMTLKAGPLPLSIAMERHL